MSKLTFGDVKTPCARVLSMVPTDPRVAEYVNRAQARLMGMSKNWVGTVCKYRICVTESCLTWPREIASIISYSICDKPGAVRGQWYEFLSNGPGIMCEDDCNSENLIHQNESPAYDDPNGGTDKVFRIYVGTVETTTEPLIIQHFDAHGNWVRTQKTDGTWIDGEEITIPTNAGGQYASGTKTIMKSGLVRVIKPVTNGPVILFEQSISDGSMKNLATWQADETTPSYRRSMIPGITGTTGSGDSCSDISVTVLAKLRHIPVANDNDFMILTSVDAFVEECKSIRRREDNLDQEGEFAHQMAIKILDDELDNWNGSGTVQPLNLQSRTTYGGGILEIQ